MTNDSNSQPGLIQSNDLSSSTNLKLIVSNDSKEASKALKKVNSKAISNPVFKSAPTTSSSFTAEIRKRSPYDFIMVARDPFHYLHCELPLTFEEDQEGGKRSFSLVCQFPTISDDDLVDFIEEDEDLLGMVLISFHMHILKNLLSFCGAQKAKNLILQATEEQFKGMGMYQEFIKHVDKIPTKKEIKLEITIPVHSTSLTTCNEFMDDMTRQFRKTLWEEQRTNSAIRGYLKANVRLSIVRETSGEPS